MRLIDFLFNTGNVNIKLLKLFIDNPKKEFRAKDLGISGCMKSRYYEILHMFVKDNIIIRKYKDWITGRHKIKRKGYVYKLNNENPIVKLLKQEIEEK